jgi:hypothetical protein
MEIHPHPEHKQGKGSQDAATLRAIVTRHSKNIRSGAIQRDIDEYNKDLEQFAVSLEEQDMTAEEKKKKREEQGKPDPNKLAAVRAKETIEHDRKEAEERKKRGEPEPGTQPPPPATQPAKLTTPAAVAVVDSKAGDRSHDKDGGKDRDSKDKK